MGKGFEKDNTMLCMKCNSIVYTKDIIDIENDGDIVGTCPKCKKEGIFVKDDDDYEDFNEFENIKEMR